MNNTIENIKFAGMILGIIALALGLCFLAAKADMNTLFHTNKPESYSGTATIVETKSRLHTKPVRHDYDLKVCTDVNNEDTCWWEDVNRTHYNAVEKGQQITFTDGAINW